MFIIKVYALTFCILGVTIFCSAVTMAFETIQDFMKENSYFHWIACFIGLVLGCVL